MGIGENMKEYCYGIDFGNTTSSIASFDGEKTDIVLYESNNQSYVMSKEGCISFRQDIGSKHVYKFEKSGLEMTPVDLSAEILKNLRQFIMESEDTDPTRVTITVPADFNALQRTPVRLRLWQGLMRCHLYVTLWRLHSHTDQTQSMREICG